MQGTLNNFSDHYYYLSSLLASTVCTEVYSSLQYDVQYLYVLVLVETMSEPLITYQLLTLKQAVKPLAPSVCIVQ